jgi:putative ABC transport system substrate-binding protein
MVRVPTIGWLDHSSPKPEVLRLVELFRKGLRDVGYIEGKSIAIEYRYAQGSAERLSEFAAELVRLKVDCIVACGRTTNLQTP